MNSNDASEFVSKVSEFSKNSISNKEDLTRISAIVINNGLEQEFEKLVFNAKFLQGLLRIIRNKDNSIDAEYFEKVTGEYHMGLEKIKSGLKNILSYSDEFYRNIFEEKYMEMTHKGMANLTGLCDDLSWVKMFLNNEKQKANARK
ncbi:MAG: hypothetical protein K9J12_08240 [Melioribacteraceae bacterium]|nr:hypothetical protein [Melioribacteraceae bacterium]MCF8264118.1 hypothetical protein [Melioribacteraceae bacterium]